MPRKYFFSKPIILLVGLICISALCEAKVLSGYIITENSDTIWGKIRVCSFNKRTGGWVFNGIDLEWCYHEAAFKKSGEYHFKSYSPDKIKGYGFTYKDQEYVFNSLEVNYKSMNKRERKLNCFLNLFYSINEIEIYRHQRYMDAFYLNKASPFESSVMPTYEFYMRNKQRVLQKINIHQFIK